MSNESESAQQSAKHSTKEPAKRRHRVTCAPGLSPALETELQSLGLTTAVRDHTGVELNCTMTQAMQILLHSRIAFHVLQRFGDLWAKDADGLYEGAVKLPWERVIPADGYVCVTSVVDNPTIRNSMFANVRLKDAIVDRISDCFGRRPDAGSDIDRAVVHLYWKQDDAKVWLSLSGRKLSDRGYRRLPGKAPLRESIVAAMLAEAKYDGTRPLVVPFCGSGTIAIEAALMATGRATGLLRTNMGIQHLKTFDPEAWGRVKAAPAPIIVSDIDEAMVDAAYKNAVTAGVDQLIEFHCCDFADTPLPDTPGIIIMHGEYGQRLDTEDDLQGTYGRMGDYMKQCCAGWDAYVFTERSLLGAVGLKASQRTPYVNGDIDCRFARYELYDGVRQ
jgi:putative N6-adenine-specific DNA methylase